MAAPLIYFGRMVFAKRDPILTENATGPSQQSVTDVLAVGDLIRVAAGEDGDWQLAQIPAAQAALVSLNPNNGAIVSMVGGIGFEVSKFNRATQAERQPGSNFKPFLYSAALDTGYTAATLINDAPVVMEGGGMGGMAQAHGGASFMVRRDCAGP